MSTTEDTPQEERAPLWSDEDCRAQAENISLSGTTKAEVYTALLFLRDEYETDRQRTHAALAAANERIAKLEAGVPSAEVIEFVRQAVIDEWGTPWSASNDRITRLYKAARAWLEAQQEGQGETNGE